MPAPTARSRIRPLRDSTVVDVQPHPQTAVNVPSGLSVNAAAWSWLDTGHNQLAVFNRGLERVH